MISIVIPAYNEEKYIAKTLTSLTLQSTKQLFEVLVVDNNSTDHTCASAESFTNTLNIRIIVEKKKGRGAARAAGFEQAKGEIVFSTDADTIVPPNWIEELTKYFTNKDIVAVTGTCTIRDCSFLSNFLFNHLYQPSNELAYRIVSGHWCLIGPNFAIRRDVYQQSVGLNSRLNCREDADLAEKMAKLGKIKRITLPVIFSGRRYKKGLLRGVFPYFINRIKEHAIGRDKILLDDVR